MSRGFASGFGLLAALACGCAEPGRPAESPVEGKATMGALPPSASEVAEVRGLAYRRPVALENVSRSRFRSILKEVVVADEARLDTLKAFGFAHPLASASEGAELRFLTEQHVGLYIPERRAVVVRQRVPGEPAEANPERVVVHELVHALQDDHFPLAALRANLTYDERLARRALYEGDAELTTALVLARRDGKADAEVLEDLYVTALAEAAARQFMTNIEGAPALLKASALVRAELSFPYGAGARFAVRFFRSGGSAALDKVYAALPVSTEQVLHPEKYVEGELPVPVKAPAAPPGYAVLASGTLGELGASALLSLELPPEEALPAAAGWGGDAYTVVRHETTHRLAVLWSTVWDEEANAARFAGALQRATACGTGASRPCYMGPVGQARNGTVVVWMRGFDEGDSVLDPLFDLPGERLASRPPALGFKLAAMGESSNEGVAKAMDKRRRVTLPAAGLRLAVPPGFTPKPAKETEVLLARKAEDGRGASATVSFVAEAPTDRTFEALRVSVATSLGVALSGARTKATPDADRNVTTPIGKGRELRWVLEGDAKVVVSLLVLPRCNGAATLLITRVVPDVASATALDQWLTTFENAGIASGCPTSALR
jgi:hypothetical protein